ncbi:hypothetical protein R6Q59_012242 [Mikania micrantha]
MVEPVDLSELRHRLPLPSSTISIDNDHESSHQFDLLDVDIIVLIPGVNTAALSTTLFENGLRCGACFELKCVNDSQWCHPDSSSILITATNSCPPNFAQPSDNSGWCNLSRTDFDLVMPMFLKIAEYRAGIVLVSYRRFQITLM